MKRGTWIVGAGLCGMVLAGCQSLSGGLFGGGNTEPIGAFIPEGIDLDTSELPTEESAAEKSINAEMPNGLVLGYRRTLYTAASIVFGFHHFADRSLALAARIRLDMDSADQTQVEGEFTVGGETVQYRADFAAFDFDGDGAPDGSGNAVDLPVALRVWTDRGDGFERFLCALVTVKPSEDNLGAGAMYVYPNAANEDAYDDLRMFVEWDRTDPAHKWNESVLTGQIGPFYRVTSGRARVDVREYDDESVEKTVRSAVNHTANPWGFEVFSSASHWRRGEPFVLISGEATGGTAEASFTNICLDLENREPAVDGQCDTFDTQDMTFVDPPVGDETAFPAGFPETPTFEGGDDDDAGTNDDGDDA